MIDILTLSIGIGLVVALLFAEFFGFKAGGLVVPGYFALYLMRPESVLLTLGIAAVTFFCLRLLSSLMIIYGKRRTALAILIGYLLGALVRLVLDTPTLFGPQSAGLEVIGYIIPGLVALWMDRQGIAETITSLVTVAAVVRILLIVLAPSQLELFESALQESSKVPAELVQPTAPLKGVAP
jgi:poly-gamma-glutamate biosynthesis protein PgsC/CapC